MPGITGRIKVDTKIKVMWSIWQKSAVWWWVRVGGWLVPNDFTRHKKEPDSEEVRENEKIVLQC